MYMCSPLAYTHLESQVPVTRRSYFLEFSVSRHARGGLWRIRHQTSALLEISPLNKFATGRFGAPMFSDTAITDRHSDTTIFQLRAHWVRIFWSIGLEKSFRRAPGGS